jgi:hypothetical protein
MAGLEAEIGIEAARRRPALMHEELDQPAMPAARLGDGPAQHAPADALAAKASIDPDILDQGALGALEAQARDHRHLQIAEHRAVVRLRHHEDVARIARDCRERRLIGRGQGILDPFARAAEMIVGEQADDRRQIAASCRPHDDGLRVDHPGPPPARDRPASAPRSAT